MKLTVAGVGPGNSDIATYSAIKAAQSADLVLTPYSKTGAVSVAESVLRHHLPDIRTVPFVFPMVNDPQARDAKILEQLQELKEQWQGARSVVLPVIGDSALYATGSYLYSVWRSLVPGLELELIPGVSAHSFAASCAGRFLAMGENILAIIPATAHMGRIKRALACCDCAAVYKPSALKENLRTAVEAAGPWAEIVRVDRAGLSDEKIYRGSAALDAAEEYLSLLLLWR